LRVSGEADRPEDDFEAKQAQQTENQLESRSIASRFAVIDGSIQRTAAR
jgi:hypothetical protein